MSIVPAAMVPTAALADDTVWINLKVVASLPPHHRLNTQHELFYHQAPHWWTSVCRTFQGARRTECVRRLGTLVARALTLWQRYVAASDVATASLRTHLVAAMAGVRELQRTYKDDATTSAALERILDKIAVCVGGDDGGGIEEDAHDDGTASDTS